MTSLRKRCWSRRRPSRRSRSSSCFLSPRAPPRSGSAHPPATTGPHGCAGAYLKWGEGSAARMPTGPGQATMIGGAMMPETEAMIAAAETPAGNGTEAPGVAMAETRHPGRALSAATNSLRERAVFSLIIFSLFFSSVFPFYAVVL